MSNKAFLSIQGCFMYDSTIFDGLKVPEGVNKDVVIQNITMECSDLELIYPDVNVMKNLIEQWSIVELPIWEKYYLAQTAEFNPLYNVDAYEFDTEERNLKNTSNSNAKGSNSNVNKVGAYNTNDMATREQNDGSDESSVDAEGTDSGTIKHTVRRYGNIGVTKSTDLLFDYKDYIEQTNIYKFITDSFMKRFCLMIY